MTTKEILERAKVAEKALRNIDENQIDNALVYMANALLENTDIILRENEKDIADSKEKISDVMIDRLTLSKSRIEGMAKGIIEVKNLPYPCGKVLETVKRPNGLLIQKISVPIGVIAIIFESRPNVSSDAATLSLKSGNVCVLRGGKEAYRTVKAICDSLRLGIEKAGLPKDAIQLIDDTTRESARELMVANGYIDLLIPRGGKGLIKACIENATVPCLETGTGICHVYVDESADEEKALSIIENAKTSRPSVCNAEEVLLVNEKIANTFLPKLKEILVNKRIENGLTPVLFKADEKSYSLIGGDKASESDFDTEFLDYILAVKTVKDAKEAVEHISLHSTHHSDAIITEDVKNADYFIKNVDSSAVYVNASTRFTDGGEFGLGCEMGISTQKMHARGPLGLKELTTYKYIIKGNGQIR